MATRKKAATPPPDEPQLALPAAAPQEPGAMPAKKRKLLAVEIRNFLGVEFCRIDFTRALTMIGGKNRSGKSSTLKGIKGLLTSADTLPTDPIRDGAPSARLWGDFGDFTVERLIDPDLPKGTTLSMLDEDFNPVPKPHTELARMYNALSFDPMAFAELARDKQDAILRELAKLDFKALTERRLAAYTERTSVNAVIRDLEARFKSRKHHEDAPDREVDVAGVTAKLSALASSAEKHGRIAAAATEAARVSGEAKALVAALEQKLADAKAAAARAADQMREADEADLASSTTLAEGPVRAELEALLMSASETNRKVAANQERRQLGSELNAKKAREDELSRAISQCDEEKAALIAAAEFPIAGLGFDEYGPTYKGHPIDQASDSERWRIGAAIAIALNPQLPLLLIRSGSDLDDETLAEMHDWAEQHGAQLVIEVVRPDGKDCDILMEAGVGKQVARG